MVTLKRGVMRVGEWMSVCVEKTEYVREDERVNQRENESALLTSGWMVYYSTMTNERMRMPYLPPRPIPSSRVVS